MKREYEKPSVKVERYESDVCVAASYCNEATTLYCLVAGQTHSIFSSGQDGCGDTSGVSKIYISGYTWQGYTIEAGYYYVWYDGKYDDFTATYDGETIYTYYMKYELGYGSGYHIAQAVTEYSALTSG